MNINKHYEIPGYNGLFTMNIAGRIYRHSYLDGDSVLVHGRHITPRNGTIRLYNMDGIYRDYNYEELIMSIFGEDWCSDKEWYMDLHEVDKEHLMEHSKKARRLVYDIMFENDLLDKVEV